MSYREFELKRRHFWAKKRPKPLSTLENRVLMRALSGTVNRTRMCGDRLQRERNETWLRRFFSNIAAP